jgi:uncharacterized membrane protein YedE/YeeE
MLDMVGVDALSQKILWVTGALAFLFGAIVHRTHFCTMGALSDVVNMGDWSRMRQWALAMGIAILGFNGLVALGHIDVTKTLYASSRWLWLSAGVGGLMFGFGMVLASGCGSKTLVRIGGGSLKSAVVFLVIGLAAFATLKGVTAVVRVSTVDNVFVTMPQGANLSAVFATFFGLTPAVAGLTAAAVLGGGLVLWALAESQFWSFENLLAGCGVGLLVVAVWWVSGYWAFIPEHPETLEASFLTTQSTRAEALSFTAPLAHTLDWLLFFSDKTKIFTFGVAAVLGVILGAFASAVQACTFRWEGFGGVEDLANHLVGGILMGIGGVTAMGCTIGQGLSGVSTLSLTSFVAVAAIVVGALLALRYQVWRMDEIS